MIHLRLRTEFSFRKAYGKVDSVIAAAGGNAAAITDSGTWGHVSWMKACKKAGIKPIFGVELTVVQDAAKRERQWGPGVLVLAKNNAGLSELYGLVTRANSEGFYYYPRVDYGWLSGLSDDVVVIASGVDLNRYPKRSNFYLEFSPVNPAWNRRIDGITTWKTVVTGDNLYPQWSDRAAYEVLMGRDRYRRTYSQHIMTEDELRALIPQAPESAFRNTELIAAMCNAELPKAQMVVPERPKTLRAMCEDGAALLGVNLDDEVYAARLTRELDMIAEKNFEDYFYVISDMVAYAKKHMLVGPARGSSAGSLVCYLLHITDVDPITHDLMFERFIDVTREDLPDIDIDFQDNKREVVIKYLQKKYGVERVGRIGTVNRYKAKSTIGEVAAALGIPPWEVKEVKDAIVDRSTGDARAAFAVADALGSLDVGKALMAKYPYMKIAGELEWHARHSGMHAAGVIVTQEPLTNYCSIDHSGSAQIDKKDAEDLNLLKIDVLGLRTLSIIQDTLNQIGKDASWLTTYPLDDQEAFEVLNDEKYSGIFQFEGYALQSLTRQMKVHQFNDIVSITTLARPGPLHSGGATEFIARHVGNKAVTPLHPLVEDLVADSEGVVIYQEQVMSVGRKMGRLSWEDVSQLRKAMSKSLGEEFFNQYWEKFKQGAAEQGVSEREADHVWKHICTFGSWAFNKSHAVSYGLLSYWCCVLKAHHPLEFAAASMRNVKSEDQGVKILRDLVKEGFEFTPVDPKVSDLEWKVADGRLVGGLTNIKGVGPAKARDLIKRREEGKPLPPGLAKLILNPSTPYDDIFEGERRWGHIMRDPKKYGILSGPVHPVITMNDPGEYVFIAKLLERNLRDLNEYGNVVKRGGRLVKNNNLFLNMVLEDDTGSIICKIDRWNFPTMGKPLIEKYKEGDWFIWKGAIRQDGWRLVFIEKYRHLG